MKNKYLLRSVRQRHNRISAILVALVVLMLAVIIGVSVYRLKVKQAELDKQKAYLQEQIDAEKQREEEIEEYAKYTKTKKYAEEVAKEKLGLVGEDEIIFKSGDGE